MTKRLLIFPSTITLAWAPSNVNFTSRSTFLGIPKLTTNSKVFFVYAVEGFFFLNQRRGGGGQYHVRKIFLIFASLQIFGPLFSFVV
jgi:hypothetical protein